MNRDLHPLAFLDQQLAHFVTVIEDRDNRNNNQQLAHVDVLPRTAELSLGQPSALPARPSHQLSPQTSFG
jgi:hypothetical protein